MTCPDLSKYRSSGASGHGIHIPYVFKHYLFFFPYPSKAIVNGRPGCLTIDHTDCKLPDDLYAYKNTRGQLESGCEFPYTMIVCHPFTNCYEDQNWRTQYCITCLTVSADHVFAIKTPPYSELLEIDKRLRGIIPPEHLWTPANPKSPYGWPDDTKLACEQACARFMKESSS